MHLHLWQIEALIELVEEHKKFTQILTINIFGKTFLTDLI